MSLQRLVPALLAAAIAAASLPGSAEEGLFQRNVRVLLATLPEGAVLEVRVAGPDGAEVVELWTAHRYASFRADVAARMGRDHTAAPEGVPGGIGNQQYLHDIWSDLWGETRVNIATQLPTGFCLLPRTIPIDGVPPASPQVTLTGEGWLYGGRGSVCFAAEHANQCLGTRWGSVCSSTYGWVFPQAGSEHGDAWLSGWGFLTLFPPPFGAVAIYNGAAFTEDLA